ncbi:unnamed protein product [Meloidogyne enterolobii]|uniref:Uncharacterized protein n=2 Tax=Meloidogyne enterolobii TaxID=390850 RepID=A0ACB0ZQE2_MELEN
MANKFILVPEDIYRGLTTYDAGDPNLDFIRSDIEKIKRKKDNPSAKNVKYNQELRRYLHIRNEQQNKPVKVEMVANPKGAIMSTNATRPSSNLTEDDDDLLTTDDISLPSYPIPPKDIKSISTFNAPNVPPPPSLSSTYSAKKHLKNIGDESPPIPPLQQPIVKRENKTDLKKYKVKKHIKKVKKVSKNKKRQIPQGHSENIETNYIKTPASPSPPIYRKVTKREQENNEFEGVKRKKRTDKNRDEELKQETYLLKQKAVKLKHLADKRKILSERRKTSQKTKVPLDPYEIRRLRDKENEKSKSKRKIMREGRSPSPPISRQKVKRKFEGPIENEMTVMKRQRKVTKKQSKRASNLWVKNLKKRNVYKSKSKWAIRKPTQKDINSFKPSLW